MKYLAWFMGVVVSLVAVVYTVAFTSFGNNLLKPSIEQTIQNETKLDSKLSKFSLSMSEIDIILEITPNNSVYIKGTYSLFDSSFNIDYKVVCKKLNELTPLAKTELHGVFNTDGNVKGNPKLIDVEGKSDVASSATTYKVELKDMKPSSIIAKVEKLKLDELLVMIGQKAYASADVNLEMNFKNIEPHKLDGDVLLSTSDAKIDTKVMKDEFNIVVPKSSFAMRLDAKLKGDDVDYKYKLISKLFQIHSSGNLVPQPLKTDIKYSVNIGELALLKPITGADVRGAFRVHGDVKGTKEKMVVSGKSDVAFSQTDFKAVLKNFEPANIKADMKNVRLAQVFYMIKQPHYADGLFSLHVDITDARKGKLKGVVDSNIKKGLLDSEYLTKAYEFKTKMPRTTFKLNTHTKLDANTLKTKLTLNSTLADVDVKDAKFDLKDSSLRSDYLAEIRDLSKLYFATGQKMRGSLEIVGDVKKAKDFDLSMHTKVARGDIDATLHNDKLKATLSKVETMGLLYMLRYPELLKATLDAKVDYDLDDSKGRLDGKINGGHFVKNQAFDLIKRYAKIDMYKESFNGDVLADINKEKILVDLDLKSRTSAIQTKRTKLNTKTKQIDSKLLIIANKNPINTHLTGDINKPKVSVDLEAFMKTKAGKKVEREINRLFRKLF
jgi:hypothetical protein